MGDSLGRLELQVFGNMRDTGAVEASEESGTASGSA
jgi:hypothetical protein